jgi:hypothetical protein
MQSQVSVLDDTTRRLPRLVEPIHLVTYFSEEPTDALLALGLRNYWDGYFAGRAAPLGRVPAEVVHAIFYNFADGEVIRHIPRVWDTVTPEAALAAREQGSVAALRRILGDLADAPVLRVRRTSPPGRRSARPLRDGSCTPRSGRSRYPRSPSPGSGTRPPCSASTAGTVISLPWSPRASEGRRPMCSTRSPRTSPRRSSEGSTTSLRTGWPGLWTGCRPAVSCGEVLFMGCARRRLRSCPSMTAGKPSAVAAPACPDRQLALPSGAANERAERRLWRGCRSRSKTSCDRSAFRRLLQDGISVVFDISACQERRIRSCPRCRTATARSGYWRRPRR